MYTYPIKHNIVHRSDCRQLDISEDGFLNLMDDTGTPKDDVKLPDGEVGEKITKLFQVEEKDTSKYIQMSTSLLSWLFVDVIVLTAMGEELAMDAKEAPKG